MKRRYLFSGVAALVALPFTQAFAHDNDRRHLSMLEDFWLPLRSSSLNDPIKLGIESFKRLLWAHPKSEFRVTQHWINEATEHVMIKVDGKFYLVSVGDMIDGINSTKIYPRLIAAIPRG